MKTRPFKATVKKKLKFQSFDEGVHLFRKKIMISDALSWVNVVLSQAVQSDSNL